MDWDFVLGRELFISIENLLFWYRIPLNTKENNVAIISANYLWYLNTRISINIKIAVYDIIDYGKMNTIQFTKWVTRLMNYFTPTKGLLW